LIKGEGEIILPGEIKLDSKKLKKALEYEENRFKLKNNEVEIDDRKRPYNSAYMGKNNSTEAEVTEEDLEAYRLKKNNRMRILWQIMLMMKIYYNNIVILQIKIKTLTHFINIILINK